MQIGGTDKKSDVKQRLVSPKFLVFNIMSTTTTTTDDNLCKPLVEKTVRETANSNGIWN